MTWPWNNLDLNRSLIFREIKEKWVRKDIFCWCNLAPISPIVKGLFTLGINIITARNEVGSRLCFYTCLWFCSRGGGEGGLCPIACWDTPPPRSRPTRTRHPRGQSSPGADPPGPDTPQTVHAGRYGQQAGGTHPTGMQSCWFMPVPFKPRVSDGTDIDARKWCSIWIGLK